MKWIEITVHTTTEGADLVADVFFSQGGNGVLIKDRTDLLNMIATTPNWDYMDENLHDEYNDETVIVKGFVLKSCYKKLIKIIEQSIYELKKNSDDFLNLGTLEIVSKEIEDEDFNNVWKEHFRPITIGDIIICPKWIKLEKHDIQEKKVVLIDPGMAFGTGEHETTRLCIELMQLSSLVGKTVMDIGCGSGILGICAIKLGAAKSYMSDFDIMAVKATNQNTKLNNSMESAVITQANLLDNNDATADLIMINIVAEVLIPIAPYLKSHLNKGAKVILSGIIEPRLQKVVEAYENCGFKLIKTLKKGEWFGLLLE